MLQEFLGEFFDELRLIRSDAFGFFLGGAVIVEFDGFVVVEDEAMGVGADGARFFEVGDGGVAGEVWVA